METPEQIIEILKENSVQDHQDNQLWIKGSMGNITRFYILEKNKNHENTKNSGKTVRSILAKKLEKSIKKDQKRLGENYSWEIIHQPKTEKIPKSTIVRNKLWAKVIAEEIQRSSSDSRPLLIVVGRLHLAGFQDSFLSYLLKKLGTRPIYRLTNTGEWIEIEQNKK